MKKLKPIHIIGLLIILLIIWFVYSDHEWRTELRDQGEVKTGTVARVENGAGMKRNVFFHVEIDGTTKELSQAVTASALDNLDSFYAHGIPVLISTKNRDRHILLLQREDFGRFFKEVPEQFSFIK